MLYRGANEYSSMMLLKGPDGDPFQLRERRLQKHEFDKELNSILLTCI